MKHKTFSSEGHLHEACGVFGVYSPCEADLAPLVYGGLFALQHRGQESAGIVIYGKEGLSACHGMGLVSEVCGQPEYNRLQKGHVACGHVRYGTTGADSRQNIQPLVINHHRGTLALAHNGNLTNAGKLRTEMEDGGAVFYTTTDSEVIAYRILQELLHCSSLEEAAGRTMQQLEGAYSLVIGTGTKLIALRDPFGFRPLCLGEGADHTLIAASESCALDAVGARFVRDVRPGEIVVMDSDGFHSYTSFCEKVPRRLCVFEYIYFARPDSVIDGSSVCLARQQAGALLAAQKIIEADVVIGVPDSGLDAALGYANASGIPYAIGFTKNKYIGRTFIAPTQGERESGVGMKLNPIRSVVEGKRVVLIDDSIVRGTTCRRIIEKLRQAGAAQIYMCVSAPPFVAPCFYGTDIDRADHLIANQHSIEEIAQMIGADDLSFLSLENAHRLTGRDEGFCTACFGGGYPTAVPEEGEKNMFEKELQLPV